MRVTELSSMYPTHLGQGQDFHTGSPVEAWVKRVQLFFFTLQPAPPEERPCLVLSVKTGTEFPSSGLRSTSKAISGLTLGPIFWLLQVWVPVERAKVL